MSHSWLVNSDDKLKGFLDHVHELYEEHKHVTFSWRIGIDRTLEQNKLIYALYNDIAKQLDGWTFLDVKRHCKLHIGLRQILLLDDGYTVKWAELLNAMKVLNEEQKLILMDVQPVTSEFKRNQGSEYIDLVHQEFSRQGVRFST